MDDDETTDVVIEVDATPDENESPDVVVDEGDTLVVVETPAESGEELDPFTERFVLLEERVRQLEEKVWQTGFTADVALDTAEEALAQTDELAEVDAEIVEGVDEIVEDIDGAEIEGGGIGEEDTVKVDTEPLSARVHPLFRSLGDWKNR